MADPDATLQLLYVTPEKFVKSKSLLNKLEKAHEQHRLKRIVIDEVHCCSEWGHDFRPDYQKLNLIKIQFKAVPLMYAGLGLRFWPFSTNNLFFLVPSFEHLSGADWRFGIRCYGRLASSG